MGAVGKAAVAPVTPADADFVYLVNARSRLEIAKMIDAFCGRVEEKDVWL